MFRFTYLVVIRNEEDVYRAMKEAANYELECLYKIGVYGNLRQHELWIKGYPWDYRKFKKLLNISDM